VPILRAFLPLMIGAGMAAAPAAPAAPPGAWGWPVLGPVVREFDPPETPFGAGHRGIDIATPVGTTVLAPESGVVAFAGRVGGELFVTLDHGGGLTSTYSWLASTLVRVGDAVARGAPIAQSGRGHPGSVVPHLHFGVRRDDVYLDPLAFLGPLSVSGFIRLAPLSAAPVFAERVGIGLAA
jgi:murein DD-endopeptidase MepM/ murein hydrolase activator NlpD